MNPTIRAGAIIVAAALLIVAGLYAIGAPERRSSGTEVTPAAATVDTMTIKMGRRTTPDANRAPYGSGTLSSWTGNTPSISTTAQFQNVRATNGVMLIGDSIARAAQTELAQRMMDEHGLYTAVNNWPGRPTDPAVDWLVEHAHWVPNRGVIMAVGANDIFNPLNWYQQVQRVLDAVDGKPVYWVTVHVDRWTGDADRRTADQRNSSWINQQLYAMAIVNPNLKVVDWHTAVASGSNEARVVAWLTDGVHLTNPSGVYGWCNQVQNKMGL